MPKTTLQWITGVVILGSWFIALLNGILGKDYEGLQLVTPVMLVYAGYIFGDSFFTRKNKEQ